MIVVRCGYDGRIVDLGNFLLFFTWVLSAVKKRSRPAQRQRLFFPVTICAEIYIGVLSRVLSERIRQTTVASPVIPVPSTCTLTEPRYTKFRTKSLMIMNTHIHTECSCLYREFPSNKYLMKKKGTRDTAIHKYIKTR